MRYPARRAADLQPGVSGSVVVADPTGDGAVDGPSLLPTQVLLGQGREVRRDLLVDPRCGSKGPVHVRRYLGGVPEDADGVVLGSLEEHFTKRSIIEGPPRWAR